MKNVLIIDKKNMNSQNIYSLKYYIFARLSFKIVLPRIDLGNKRRSDNHYRCRVSFVENVYLKRSSMVTSPRHYWKEIKTFLLSLFSFKLIMFHSSWQVFWDNVEKTFVKIVEHQRMLDANSLHINGFLIACVLPCICNSDLKLKVHLLGWQQDGILRG